MGIAEKILQHKLTTITLRELEQLCRAPDYRDFVSEIKSLSNSGLLRPMGKNTNGMTPPLYTRYHICHSLEDISAIKDEILRLGPDFNPSGYLSNINLYKKHRDMLQKLAEYVNTNSAEIERSMSKNERAYAIWGDEKLLDDSLCKNMLRVTGWGNKLNYYDTPEPFLDYLCNGSATKSILILENKDIWFSLRKIFMESKTAYRIYGEFYDGLLYGEGKKITRPGALEDYSNEGFSVHPSFSYWGDLDYEGIGIYLKIAVLPVRLFVAGYMSMLDYGKGTVLTRRRTNQIPPSNLDDFLRFFDNHSAKDIRALLEEDKYIPQEICSYPRIKMAVDTAV